MPCKWLRGSNVERFYCALKGNRRGRRFDEVGLIVFGCLENSNEGECYEEAEPEAKEEKDALQDRNP